jgi:hypothetical protein
MSTTSLASWAKSRGLRGRFGMANPRPSSLPSSGSGDPNRGGAAVVTRPPADLQIYAFDSSGPEASPLAATKAMSYEEKSLRGLIY